MDECKPLVGGGTSGDVYPLEELRDDLDVAVADYARFMAGWGFWAGANTRPLFSSTQAFLWDRGCILGFCRGCLAGVRGYQGVSRVYFVSETAYVEPKSGRV